MKSLPILYAASLLASTSSGVVTRAIYNEYTHRNKIDKVIVHPVGGVGRKPHIIVKFSFSRQCTRNAYVRLSIKNKNYSNPATIYSYSTMKIEDSFVFEYDNSYLCYTNDRLVVKLSSEYGSDEVTVYLFTRDSKRINVNNELTEVDFAKNISIGGCLTGGNIIKGESAKFRMPDTNILTAISSGFNFRDFYAEIEEIEGYSLECGYAILNITDGFEDFPNIGSVINNSRRAIPIEYKALSDSRITLKFKNDLFVHPITHAMSETYRNGYVKTDKLFFPNNSAINTSYKMQIYMEDFGINDSTVTYTFNLTLSEKIVGNCIDSRYCVISKAATPNIDLGEKITR